MEHISNFQNLSWRRKALALALTGLLAVTGVASFAALTDNLVVTNNYSVLSMDLQASKDGVLYEESITFDWSLATGTRVAKILTLKNNGNGQGLVSFASSATGAASITGANFSVGAITDEAQCPTVGALPSNHTVWNPASDTVATAASNGIAEASRTLATDETRMLCLLLDPAATFSDTDVATQTLTFTITGNLSNQ